MRNFAILFLMLLLGANLSFAKHYKKKVDLRKQWAEHVLYAAKPDSQLYQNQKIDQEGLARIQTDSELKEMVKNGELVALPKSSKAVKIDSRLKKQYRFCRPSAAEFIVDFGNAYYQKFHRSIRVNSAVRSAQRQRAIAKKNHNAAPSSGEEASAHLTGIAVDIALKGVNAKQHDWMQAYLKNLVDADCIYVIEEYNQRVFHIAVFDNYKQCRG